MCIQMDNYIVFIAFRFGFKCVHSLFLCVSVSLSALLCVISLACINNQCVESHCRRRRLDSQHRRKCLLPL